MIALLPILRRFWFAIPIALLLVALLFTRSTNARHRAELAACEQTRKIDEQSIIDLTAAVKDQNAKVAALSDAGAKHQQAAMDALKRATEREKASQATVDSLRRSAGLKRAVSAPCVVSTTLAGAKGL